MLPSCLKILALLYKHVLNAMIFGLTYFKKHFFKKLLFPSLRKIRIRLLIMLLLKKLLRLKRDFHEAFIVVVLKK